MEVSKVKKNHFKFTTILGYFGILHYNATNKQNIHFEKVFSLRKYNSTNWEQYTVKNYTKTARQSPPFGRALEQEMGSPET